MPDSPGRFKFNAKTKLHELLGLDVRSLAVVRIAIGALLLLIDLATRSRFIQANYTDLVVLPRQYFPGILRFSSLHLISGDYWFQAALFVVTAIFAAMLMIGFWTRVATFASRILLVSLQHRQGYLTDGGDIMLKMLLFWGMFLPLAARWSIDAKRAKKPFAGRHCRHYDAPTMNDAAPLTIADFQAHIRDRYYEADNARGAPATFMWLIEEVGELATALQAAADSRDKPGDANDLADEFADVFAWLCTLANISDVDLTEAVRKKYLEGPGPPDINERTAGPMPRQLVDRRCGPLPARRSRHLHQQSARLRICGHRPPIHVADVLGGAGPHHRQAAGRRRRRARPDRSQRGPHRN